MQKPKKIVIIGGCGHVGLPLGIVFANCGLDVVLLDRDQAKIETVNGGQMPFMETNALEQLETGCGQEIDRHRQTLPVCAIRMPPSRFLEPRLMSISIQPLPTSIEASTR